MKIGIYQPYWGTIGGGQAHLGAAAEVLARTHDVEMIHHCERFDICRTQEALDLDLSCIHFRLEPKLDRPSPAGWNLLRRYRKEQQWCAELSQDYDMFINCNSIPPFFCHAPRGVAFVFFPEVSKYAFHGRDSETWNHRPAFVKAAARLYQNFEWKRRCASYQVYVTNSIYSQRWLKSLWGVQARVAYPPLRPGLSKGEKENLVLSIGRFDASGHKKPEVMIDAFKSLCDQGLRDWRYVLVGPITQSPEHCAYLDKLKSLCHGYPISLRTNISAQDLRSLLATAALFWHSMGYGVDAERNPGLLEHFGMVATEAMAAGCVPVLFNGGGLTEVVADGQNGILWSTVDELKAHTRELVDDANLRSRLAGAAVIRAKDFSREAFEKAWLDAINCLLF